jgi:two-component system, OmpR family, response regulator ChvI
MGSSRAAREQAGDGLKHLVVRTTPDAVTKWPQLALVQRVGCGPTVNALSECSLRSQMKRKPASPYASNHQFMVQSLRSSGVDCTAEPKSGALARFPASPLMSRPEEGEADPIRVLIVEDDEDYREIVGDELSWHGFAVRSFANGDALLGSLDAAAEADVIVLDWRLPTISGIDLLPQLRQRGVNLPVVFLTSHADPAYEKRAFERGALDFIDKTRGVEVLARRLRLVAKSGKPAATPEAEKPIVCGKLVLSPSASRAYWNGVDVGLTVSEYDIVHFLASNVGNYATCRAIYDLQYYEGFVAGKEDQGYRSNVRSSIKRIRRKFCEVDSTFSELQNSPPRRYRWRGLTRSQ